MQRRNPAATGDVLAVGFMVLATLCFVGMTASVKALSADYGTIQIVWARYAVHLLLVVALLGGRLQGVLRPQRPGLQLLRSLMVFAATAFSFLALRFMPLADVAAINFLTPILVTALAALVLGEAVGIRRWTAVAVGFLGALVIVRPGLDAHPAAVAAVACAFAYALYQITTRLVGEGAPPLVSLFFSALVGTVVSTLAVPLDWTTPDARGWALMALAGTLGAAGHLAIIRALARAPASFVTPFGYAQLIWAVALGYLVFGDVPDLWTLVGALMIAGSGLYVLHRERVRKGAAEAAPPEPPS